MNYKSIALYVCLLAGLAFGQTPTTVNGVPNQSTNAATAAGNNTFSGVNSFTSAVSAPNLVTTNATGAQNVTGSAVASFCAPIIAGNYQMDCLVDYFSAGGSNQGAWSNATSYVIGNAVSYSGLLWVATGPSTNVTPSLATAYPWAATNSLELTDNISATDLAFYYVLGQAANASTLYRLYLGNNYVTSAGWNMGYGIYGVSLIGSPPYTTLGANRGMTDMISHFDAPTGTPLLGYLQVSNIYFACNASAKHAWTLNSLNAAIESNLNASGDGGGCIGHDYWTENGDISPPGGYTGANYTTNSYNVVNGGRGINPSQWATWTIPSGGNGAWTLVSAATANYLNTSPLAYLWPQGMLKCGTQGTISVTMTAGRPTAVTSSGFTCPSGNLYGTVPDYPNVTYGWIMNEVDGRYYSTYCQQQPVCLYNGSGDFHAYGMHLVTSLVGIQNDGVGVFDIYNDTSVKVGVDWELPGSTMSYTSDWSAGPIAGGFDVYLGSAFYSTTTPTALSFHSCGSHPQNLGGYTLFGGPSGPIADNGLTAPFFPANLDVSAAQNCITNYIVGRHANQVVAGTNNAGIDAASVSTIASATTIAPTTKYVFVTGTAAIQTITPPTGCTTSGTDCAETLIADPATGPFTIGTSGNIYAAASPAIGTKTALVYNPATSKWY
jgi:hypothetical protein